MMMVRVKYGTGRSSGSGFTEIRGSTLGFLILLSGSRIGFSFFCNFSLGRPLQVARGVVADRYAL